MPLPICEKTWAFDVNNVCGAITTAVADTRDFLLQLKNALVGLGWIVWGSCDSVSSNIVGTDLWLSTANIVFASGAGAKSWIVLKNAGLAPECALLISCTDTGSGYSSLFEVCTSGYGITNGGASNGSTTAPPSGLAANVIMSTSMNAAGSPAFSNTMHAMMSNDGECTRVFWTDASLRAVNTYVGFLIIDKAKNPVAEWTVPVYAHAQSGDIGTALSPTSWGSSNVLKSKQGGTVLDMRATCEASGNTTYLSGMVAASDDASSDWPMLPMSLCCVTVGHRNWRKGQVYDLWWGSGSIATGDTYPAAGSTRQFIQVQQLILPWDGLVVPGGTAVNLG
jgi:hypothetical protein